MLIGVLCQHDLAIFSAADIRSYQAGGGGGGGGVEGVVGREDSHMKQTGMLASNFELR